MLVTDTILSTKYLAHLPSGLAQLPSIRVGAGLQFFPLSPNTLELYVVVLARRVQYGTIKVYLSALKYFNNLYGFSSALCFTPRLQYLLRGV